MEYREAVAEARRLVRRSEEDQWRLAELSFMNTHDLGCPDLCRDHATQRQWAQDTGISQAHVSCLRRVWLRWGDFVEDERPLFRDAYTGEQYGENLADAGKTQREADTEATVRNWQPERKAQLVKQWLADDDGGQTRAEVGRILHQHDTDTEQHLADTRQARANEGQRPDFETTESVQRVLADMAQLEVDMAKLPDALSDRSKSLLSYRSQRIKPSVDYYAGIEHEHGLSDDELAEFFGGQS